MAESVRVVVTGCSTGIGRALAVELKARGCDVLATARKLDAIEDLKKEHGIHIARADVTEPTTLQKAVKTFGDVDIVIANAGLSHFGPIVEQELEKIDQVLKTNVTGVVATAQAVAPGMIEQRCGLIVVVGSVSGAMITPYAGAYCASKAGVTAICDALRMELAPFGVQVLEVVTGSIRSNFGANAVKGSQLPEGSRYSTLQSYIDARALGSQGPQAMDAADYAKKLANTMLSATCKKSGRVIRSVPRRIVAGGNATLYHCIGQLMPRSLWAKKISKQMGLHKLAPPDAPMSPVGMALGVGALLLAVGAVGASFIATIFGEEMRRQMANQKGAELTGQ